MKGIFWTYTTVAFNRPNVHKNGPLARSPLTSPLSYPCKQQRKSEGKVYFLCVLNPFKFTSTFKVNYYWKESWKKSTSPTQVPFLHVTTYLQYLILTNKTSCRSYPSILYKSILLKFVFQNLTLEQRLQN